MKTACREWLVVMCLAGASCLCFISAQDSPGKNSHSVTSEVLPGTQALTWNEDLSVKMMDGAHRLIEEEINKSVAARSAYWHRDPGSREAYNRSVEANRQRFRNIIGIQDENDPFPDFNAGLKDQYPSVIMEKYVLNNDPELVAETDKYSIYQVRWPVLNQVNGEGLLLQPKAESLASIIVVPDADQTPEQLAGLSPGVSPESQFARHLAENGYRVLIPVIINRSFIFAGKPEQQTFRERIYRQAFHMGRHIIGFEVQKVLAGAKWFRKYSENGQKIGLAGYCEGGLIAFYAAAADTGIDVVMVSGYFDSRQRVWDEPIYRNVWCLLREFGDAEIASLIAPRPLVIEYSEVPRLVEKMENTGMTSSPVDDFPYTGYKGQLQTPSFENVQAEFHRIDELVKPAFQARYLVAGKGNKPAKFGSASALEKFTQLLGRNSSLTISETTPEDRRSTFNPEERQLRQVKEIEDHIQWLLHVSDQIRNSNFLYKVMPEFGERVWSTKPYHPYYSPDHFVEKAKEYRKYFSEEIMGKFQQPMLPANPRTRKIYDKERWTGYEVVLDVYSDLFAWGILLIPKDIKPGEKRPVVVCQHGRNGLPKELVEGNNTAYNDVAARLADQGFIVYVPHNLYRGEDRYRWLDRKANTVGKTLFSFIISQHEQTLQWLGTLSFVDKNRIAFYGLSYGGETAMRVPAVLEGYCLSICAGDFGDWTRKVVDTYFSGSFMNSMEWEMPYYNMGVTFSYAEMAYLIFPRPFMVERGHDDLVQPDEWVSYEYGKVRYFYDKFNLGDKTTIEYFNGGHSMRSVGTFAFLHKHLNWP